MGRRESAHVFSRCTYLPWFAEREGKKDKKAKMNEEEL